MHIHPESLSRCKCLDGLDFSYEKHIAEPILKRKERIDEINKQQRQLEYNRLFGVTHTHNVLIKSVSDVGDLSGLSRYEQALSKFGHLLDDDVGHEDNQLDIER